MEALFTTDYMLLWAAVLAAALFLPVRRLVWALYLRQAARRREPDAHEAERLKRRAGFTAALICLVFAVLYTSHLYQGRP